MRNADRYLIREIAAILIVKCALLGALWWGFVREARVPLDADKVALRLVAGTPSPASPDMGVPHDQ